MLMCITSEWIAAGTSQLTPAVLLQSQLKVGDPFGLRVYFFNTVIIIIICYLYVFLFQYDYDLSRFSATS